MIKNILRKIKFSILKYALYFLKKVDPFFVSRFLAESTRRVPNQQSVLQSFSPVQQPLHTTSDVPLKAIIADSGFFTDQNYLAFLWEQFAAYCSFLPQEELLRIKENLLSKDLHAIEEFKGAILDHVEKNFKKHTLQYHRMHLSILEFSENLQKNKEAFSTSTKEFPKNVFWPDPTDTKRPSSLYDDQLLLCRKVPLIDKSTPIGSMGSCFAFEIAHELQRKHYHYIVTEDNLSPHGLHNSCARWGTLFNTASFRQLVERAFHVKTTPNVVFTTLRDGKTFYLDPFREDVFFQSVQEYEQNYKLHIEAAKQALLALEVLVVTPGVNEAWRFKSCKSALSVAPWRIAPELVERHIYSVEENLENLNVMRDILRTFNPKLKIIVSLSPVPLHATFQGDTKHVVEANCLSKSTLRCAIETFCQTNQDVFYFPSFELAAYCSPNPWQNDQRHINKETVKKIMTLFESMYCHPADTLKF